MKRIVFLIAVLLIGSSIIYAKTYDFESNDLGWNESVESENGDVLIKEGVLSIEGKNDGFLSSTCYLPIDVKKSFEIKVDAFAKKIKDDAGFGVIFNCRDAYNYEMFLMTEKIVCYRRYEKGILVGERIDRIKFKKSKKAQISMHLKKSFDTVILVVDDVQVLEIPYVDYKYSGFGFFVAGKQSITFDNLETIIK